MRKTIIAGNWKMHKTCAEATALVQNLAPLVAGRTSSVDVVVCPPYTALYATAHALSGTGIRLGAQDVFWKDQGAYTGRVSPPMLLELGVAYVIVGHSEARGRFGVPEPDLTEDLLRQFGDTDASVNRKLLAALAAGLHPICCVGETIAERNAGKTDAVIEAQMRGALADVARQDIQRVIFAYEPVWAIGTGEVCHAQEANRVCEAIRSIVAGLYGSEAAEAIRVQYGGSVKPDNAASLLSQPHIDGALVGGASLKAADFAAIVNAAPKGR
ncbi:MAG: triose-phosphate isomerase [Chthonomonadales bacterium]